MSRPTWNEYFMKLAQSAADRSTCDRLHVGCVLVRDNRIISVGYNGSIAGLPHCDDVGHLMNKDKSCIRTVHAEMNAIISAARYGTAVDGATAVVTHQPCWSCLKALANAGIKRIVYGAPYGDPSTVEAARKAGLEIEHYGN